MATKAQKANDKEATERKVSEGAAPTDQLSDSTRARNEARLKAVGDNSDNNTGKSYGVSEPDVK
jgi:hypothetical protein